ncbi:hypothetical protein OROMI_023264 [Orobanche minor]
MQQDHDPINKWPVHGRKTVGSCTKRPKLGTPRDEHQPVNLDGNSVENEPDPQHDDDSHNSEEPEADYDDCDEGDYVYDESSDNKITLTLLDYRILDCPVCLEPLSIPIFQCKNGHIACCSCCTKMKNKCGKCSLQIGSMRCRAFERIVESNEVSCEYKPYGCNEKMPYREIIAHEEACPCAQRTCPVDGCGHVSSHTNLIEHIEANHSDFFKKLKYGETVSVPLEPNLKQVFLFAKEEYVVFVINHCVDDSLGSFVNVVCCSGLPLDKRRFPYRLSFDDEEMPLQIRSVAVNVSDWTASNLMKKVHLIPKDFVDSTARRKLDVVIWRPRYPTVEE